MGIMRDSRVSDDWLREVMSKNPPRETPQGLFTGPVRLSFPNLHEPIPDGKLDAGKFVSTLLIPPGTSMAVFMKAWTDVARGKFPKDFDDQGKPVGLESPFHEQREKAFGDRPRAGYTPGGIYFKCSSRYKPAVVDLQKRPVTDSSRVYAGVWAYVVCNLYAYGPPQPKKGVSFGLQTVMLIEDDERLGGGGVNPEQAFEHVTITAQSDVASRFADVASERPRETSVMPAGGHVGERGSLATHALPVHETEEERMIREMTGG